MFFLAIFGKNFPTISIFQPLTIKFFFSNRVVIGEIFPLPIRAKGVALSTASNWLWNFVIGFVTPYIVDPDSGNLGAKVFFIWGSTCTLCFLFVYFFVPETKGLSLEQVDKMMEQSTPRTSAKWKPTDTFAHEMGMTDKAGGVAAHVETREQRLSRSSQGGQGPTVAPEKAV